MKTVRLIPAATLLALAVVALVGAARLVSVERFPDSALVTGLAVALGTSAVMWFLVERRRLLRPQRGT